MKLELLSCKEKKVGKDVLCRARYKGEGYLIDMSQFMDDKNAECTGLGNYPSPRITIFNNEVLLAMNADFVPDDAEHVANNIIAAKKLACYISKNFDTLIHPKKDPW